MFCTLMAVRWPPHGYARDDLEGVLEPESLIVRDNTIVTCTKKRSTCGVKVACEK